MIDVALVAILAGSLCLDVPTEAIAERLAWEMETWDAIELRVDHDIEFLRDDPENPSPYGRIEEHYIETSSGKRLYDERGFDRKSGHQSSRYTKFFDGEKGAVLTYDRRDLDGHSQVMIRRAFGNEHLSERLEKPKPLLCYFVGRKPLHEALAGGERLGAGEQAGRPTDRFLFRGVKWYVTQDMVYDLDQLTGIPLRVESFAAYDPGGSNRPLWVWEAEAVAEADGHLYVKTSTTITYVNEAGEVQSNRRFEVREIAFDRSYPDETFWPALQPGTMVFDAIAKKDYRHRGDPGAERPAPDSSPVERPSARPLRADRQWPGRTTILSAAAIVAGVALVLVALIRKLGPSASGS